ncbi:unnamed protein product [Paramecium sonneborni]|uniref:PSI domain-containing protein n=1 Tax=Paramecium sonneborni TaxID=65129 RepID=A0A8S1JXA4_9CILI|nr:unnamed protein product [Paramecium sonneborni]
MKILWAILIVLPIVFSQYIVVSPSTACKCKQFLNEKGCNNNTLGQCYWNNKNNVCQQAQCGNIKTQNECLISKKHCYWNGQICSPFTLCANLTSQIGLICPEQNISCYGFNTNQCQSIASLPGCFTYQIGTCGQQGGYLGSDGLCTWNDQEQQCVVATNCNQLLDQQVCNKYIQNACVWDDVNGGCNQATCNQFQQQNCKFIVASLDPNQVYPCFYLYNNCQLATSQLFQTQDQCQTNTLLNYRWIGNDKQGICVSCSQQLIQPANRCSCEQFMYEAECILTEYCDWTQNSCQDISCDKITNQLQCSTNKNCYWNLSLQNCLFFSSCQQLQGLNTLACMAQSINCPNESYQNCQASQVYCNQLNQYSCDGYVTGDGICYFNELNQVCQNLQSCLYIIDENICNQIKKFCFWSTTQKKCLQQTCSNIQTQKDCTYVYKELNESDVQICQWINNKCLNAKNILTLNETDCMLNSQFTYMYTGTKCVKCLQTTLILPQQCSCTQLYLQQDCLANPICYWYGQACQLLSCLAITTQDLCIQNNLCQWTEYGCSDFQTCLGLAGATPKDCIAQSINCPYSDGVKCQNKYFYSPCQNYNTVATCTNQLGSDGLCIWNTTSNSCQILIKCDQILREANCGIYEYVCNWSNDQCNQSTCSTFKTPEQCKYYYLSLNSFTPIGCKWNIKTSVCEQVASTFLSYNSANCYLNTAKTARWSQAQNQSGVCISCGVKYLPNPYKCSCQQLISSINCIQNELCFWDPILKLCEEYSCTQLTENLCVSSMKCMWSSSGCIEFTSCSQLKGESMDECLSQTLFCPFNASVKGCSSLKDQPQCEDYKTQDACINLQGTKKQVCSWNYQYNRCTILESCNQLYQQINCEQHALYCAWVSSSYYGNCQNRTCNNYKTRYSCTYVLSLTDPQKIQSCQWLNGRCQPMIIQQAVDANTCFTNSDGTSRWSTDSLTQGFCVTCNVPSYATQYQNKCACSQILNQSECLHPFCQWTNNQCIQNSCSNIKNQFECSQQKQCYWKMSSNACYSITLSLNFCTTLKGNSSLECLAQSVNCPGTLNGFCQDSSNLQACSSITTQAACANSIGQEGYCRYQNQACNVITNCSQIKSYNYCIGFQHFCFWNLEFNQCASITCSNISDKENCTYIFQSMNSSSISMCEWNQEISICQNASLTNLNNKDPETCYFETGGTYHWSNNQKKGYCISCSLDLIQLPHTCSCDQLTNVECLAAKPKCKLSDSGSCIKNQCKDIFDQNNCSTLPSCMWSNQGCTEFTSCTNLQGTTTFDCLAQSINCPGIINQTCQSKSSLSSCSSNQTPNQCTIGTASPDGFCYWDNNTGCQQLINCDSISQLTQCNALYRICTWSSYFNKCVPFKCQDYKNQDQCTYVIVNFKDSYVELCQWQNKVCQQFTDKYYRFDEQTCYQNSGHTYRWVQDEDHGSKCQECYSSLLIAFTIALYLIGF